MRERGEREGGRERVRGKGRKKEGRGRKGGRGWEGRWVATWILFPPR